jgi:hypothetical protein
MRKYLSWVLLGAALALALGSTAANKQITRRNAAAATVTSGTLRVGMSQAEVETAVGRPEEYAAEEGDELWRYYQYDAYRRRVACSSVRFRQGQVVSFDRVEIPQPPIEAAQLAPVEQSTQYEPPVPTEQPPVYPEPPAPAAAVVAGPDPGDPSTWPQPECRMGSDGRQACGYQCRMGSDGVVNCADTPNGTCAMGADGHVVCSRLGRHHRHLRTESWPQPECRMGSNGHQACGYHCQMGSDGVVNCADTPNGRCAMGSDGHVVCSQLGR